MHNRLLSIQHAIAPEQAILIARPSDIAYVTGHEFLIPLEQEREAYLVVTQNQAILIHASFSPVSKRDDISMVSGCSPEQLKKTLESLVNKGIKTIFFDDQALFHNEYKVIEPLAVKLEHWNRSTIVGLRMRKDQNEIELIKKASKITFGAWSTISKQLAVGMTEIEVATMLDLEMKRNGATALAFPTIVCFGVNSALPHHQPTSQALTQNTTVLIDMGAEYKHYCSDMTRTVWFGDTPSTEFTEIERIVQNAYEAAIKLLQQRMKTADPVSAKDVDTAARALIGDAGYGNEFIHTTGHGLGLEIHEQPSLSWKNEQTLLSDMIITIEPGIYKPGALGYRYENTICITKSGCYELTI